MKTKGKNKRVRKTKPNKQKKGRRWFWGQCSALWTWAKGRGESKSIGLGGGKIMCRFKLEILCLAQNKKGLGEPPEPGHKEEERREKNTNKRKEGKEEGQLISWGKKKLTQGVRPETAGQQKKAKASKWMVGVKEKGHKLPRGRWSNENNGGLIQQGRPKMPQL